MKGGDRMKTQSVRRQAAVLTAANALVRALGFLLHVALGRLLGAQALGVMELGHSAHMLSIVPVTAGLPLAVSRLTAQREDARALRAGRALALRLSAVLLPLWALLAPLTARLLGDMRTLLPLWVFTPCIAVLGLSAVYNGYCYGRGSAWPPALSTLLEQVLRFALSAALLLSLPNLTVSARAAVPGLATFLAESAALLLLIALLRRGGDALRAPDDPALRREIARLSLPLTLSRLLQTLLRAALGALLPRRLTAGGMLAAQATGALGMLQGMVMPVLFLPGVVTSAVAMVGAPAVARRQGAALRRVTRKLFLSALLCGGLGMLAVAALAPLLSERVYRLPALAPLFRCAAPLTLMFALQQAAATVLSGLGEQKKTLLPTCAGAALTLLLMYRWAASPLALEGAVYALIVGRAAALLWQLAEVARAVGEKENVRGLRAP